MNLVVVLDEAGKMIRVLIHVEGQTEETFVKELLAPHLATFGVAVSARLMGNARQRASRGGVRAWSEVSRDIVNHLKGDAECVATLMVDYYGMPYEAPRDWPGRSASRMVPFEQKAVTVQEALRAEISAAMGNGFDHNRFIPFVLMHEFEGLLFSNCNDFAEGIYKPALAVAFQAIRDQFDTPEQINDSPLTAPSKRIAQLVPGYQKPLLGTLAALRIGLVAIRQDCPNFSGWLGQLEALGA